MNLYLHQINLIPQLSLFFYSLFHSVILVFNRYGTMYTWFMFPGCFRLSFTCLLHICRLLGMAWLVVWLIKLWHVIWVMTENEDIFQLMDQASTIHHLVASGSRHTLILHLNCTLFQISFLLQPVSREKRWIYQRSTNTKRKLNMKIWGVWKASESSVHVSNALIFFFFCWFFPPRTSCWNGNVICRGSEWSPRSTARSKANPRSWKGMPIHPASHLWPAQLQVLDQLKIQFVYCSKGRI